MPIDFRNTNSVWASVLTETLRRLGLRIAVICPGSRSTPLAIAFARQDSLEAIPVLDERSASFFALGLARRHRCPVALVCTSGTAGANFYPAVIEAKESQVPLWVLTADRPPELRHCNAGQTIDQQKLFGVFPNWYAELALPELELSQLAYLRQTLIHAWNQALYPFAGPVHLNIPFRDPLAPIAQLAAQNLALQFPEDFFSAVASLYPDSHSPLPQGEGLGTSAALSRAVRANHGLANGLDGHFGSVQDIQTSAYVQDWQSCHRGIIVAGIAQPPFPASYCAAIAQLSQRLGWPVLAEGLSPLRNYASVNPYLISTYDIALRNPVLAEKLAPEMVIRIGEMPTSKELRTWLEVTQARQWVIAGGDRNLDPLHGKTVHWQRSLEYLLQFLPPTSQPPSPYLGLWCRLEAQIREAVDHTMAGLPFTASSNPESQPLTLLTPFEGKVAWLLSQHLPAGTPLFIANSMPVRDVEFFWVPGNLGIQPYFNRGANGIDGTLSTALGIAHRHQSSVMLTGDLALLHDTNGFLLRRQFVGHLTIILINNNGGGIFEMLPIAQFDPPFEEFFATPQGINFSQLCTTYGVAYELIHSWEHLIQQLNPLPTQGIRVLEIKTNRKSDAQWRKQYLRQFATGVDISKLMTPSQTP
ncbi:MAG: 2-succinyl-5-enolpyruvyl-6-hydroxy-3-cyclohexene-1-carboxylic-acid synthase [Leptolyngbyaceae bacterium]|nr:2-succinyl-5-enolpyruvyl-6-hydroxy-3-cyclohexene-1-carboxylic-acid synthase [Leptolyngbyaceae bacterium]